MRALKDSKCDLCGRNIKEGEPVAMVNSFGKFMYIDELCDRSLYKKYSEIIIQKIKE